MKNITKAKLLIIIIFSLSINAYPQWSILGDSTVSYTDGDESWITVDNNGVPYIVYRDGYYLGATVKKLVGSHWVTVGVEAFSGWNHCNTMAFDNINTPYVAFQDEQNNFKATVMKFDGVNWVYVGAKGFSPDHATYTSLAIDNNGVPYVAFSDRDSTVPGGSRASVMKFNGSSWVYVGARRFSPGEGIYTSLALDKNGTPYVAFWDMTNISNQPPYKMAVMKFDGTNWVNVGPSGFAEWNGGYSQAIAIDSNNIPYVICGVGGKAAVKKYVSNAWVNVGSTGISQGTVGYPTIVIDNKNTIFIAYTDDANGQKATVKKFDGVNWSDVGNPDFSTPSANYLSFAVANNGITYAAYKDGTPHSPNPSGSSSPYYPTVAMAYFLSNDIESKEKNSDIFNIYPNPASSIIQINYSTIHPSDALLNIANVKGQSIYKETFKGNYNKEIDLSKYSRGVYFVEIIADKKRTQRKIILDY